MTKLWGGRFSKETNPEVEKFTKSIHFDKKLVKFDIWGSMIHVITLNNANYLSNSETEKLIEGLEKISEKVDENKFEPDPECEDIHTNIQNLLMQNVGDLALKLHTARSRNDQVVFATKLYCKFTIDDLQTSIIQLISAIRELTEKNKLIIIPGFTHLQHAQPVYLKDYLGSYVEMLKRDGLRLDYISSNMEINMGSGALAGTPIDATHYQKALTETLKKYLGKFAEDFKIVPVNNSIDSVSDRDFIIEIIGALSIIAMHLSRLSEDLIIWSSKEFDFIEIDEAFCTGSSLMPQKKNPDVLELVRGYTGRLYGNLVSVLTMMKGLPLTYNRDMQLDKEPLFNSFEIILSELRVLPGLIKTLKFNEEVIADHLEDESLYATDLAYFLVDKGVPFKEAHRIVGELIKYSNDHPQKKIKEMSEEDLKKFSDKFTKNEVIKRFDPIFSVESKRSINR